MAASAVSEPPAPAGFVDEPPAPPGFQDEPPAPAGFVDEPPAQPDVPNVAQVQRQARLPERQFSTPEKIQGAVQAGLNLATAVVGGTIGVGAGVATGALGLANNAAQKLTGRPVSDTPNPIEASSAIGEAVTRGLHSMLGSDMHGDDSDSAAGEKYTHDYVEPILTGMQALTGHMGEFAVAHGTAPSADAVRGAVTESGVRPAMRAIASDVVNAGGDGVQQAAGRAAAERPAPTPGQSVQSRLEGPTLQGIRNARDAGYVLTATEGGAGEALKGVEGMAGEPKLAKGASVKNQPVTDKLARQDVGLPEDEPITHKGLADIRTEEGKHYEAIKQAGDINNDQQYLDDVNTVVKLHDDAGESFPNSVDRPFQKTLEDMRAAQTMTAPAAIAQVKLLRQKSDAAFRQGDPGLSAVYKGFAKALDDSIDRHLTRLGDLSDNPELAKAVENYRAARTRIAKTYLADAALNPTTGHINAATYARAHKASPNLLTGPGRQIAEFATQFPRLARGVEKLGNTGSPTFADLALMVVTGGKEALLLGARPAARAVLLSDVGQKWITRRARNAAPVESAPAQFDPSTSPGAGPEAGVPAPPFNPLGDTTPDWQTAPGAGPTNPGGGTGPADGPQRWGGGTDIPAVEGTPATAPEAPVAGPANEQPVPRGAASDIPAVPGRPDLPDTVVSGPPSGSEHFTDPKTQAELNTPGAQEAMRRISTPPPKIPVGETNSLTPAEEAKWRKQFSLSTPDAARARDVAAAYAIDPHATELAAQLYDNLPAKFDAEIAKIKARGEANANQGNEAAAGSESAGARPGDDGSAPVPASGGDSAGSEPVRAAEEPGGSAGSPDTAGTSEPTTPGVNDGNVRREANPQDNPEGQAQDSAQPQGGQETQEGPPEAEDSLRIGTADPGSEVLRSHDDARAALGSEIGEDVVKKMEKDGLLKFALSRDEAAGRAGAGGVIREPHAKDGRPTITLYSDKLTPKTILKAFLHEHAHYGIVRLLGEKGYQRMLYDLRRLENDSSVKDIWADVKRKYTGENSPTGYKEGDARFMHEVAAHIVENQPDTSFTRRVVNEVRAYFYEKYGSTFGNRVSADVIRTLAAKALRKGAKGTLDRASTPVHFAGSRVSAPKPADPQWSPTDRMRAVKTAREIDTKAVDNAAREHDVGMEFDRAVQRIIASRKP